MADVLKDDDILTPDEKFVIFYPGKDGVEVKDPSEHSLGGAPSHTVLGIKKILLTKGRLSHLKTDQLKLVKVGQVTPEQRALQASTIATLTPEQQAERD